ncbi:MAG: AAA family ATPase [Bacteroidetes bacterium]|nr:AAA family ATPase [Bacteroidota bacterium]
MDSIHIQGYKSIKDATIELKPINILIGANGSGKSNFLSFFEFLNNLYDRKLKEYVALSGGMDRMLHKGTEESKSISSSISFDNSVNEYSFKLDRGDEAFFFSDERLWYNGNPWEISEYNEEAKVKVTNLYRAKYIRNYLNGFKKYHFHDTGRTSPFNQTSNIENDTYFLYAKGENLAAFLWSIKRDHLTVYNRIVKVIQSIAPYFSDFFLEPNANGFINLKWQDKYSSSVYGVTDLSDGTIRFIALAVLFLQPTLPSSIIIDEPELGLHPVAISKLAGLIESVASKKTQVILATQSVELVNLFQPENIITVDQINGSSNFARLNRDDLTNWLDAYSLGDLWKQNILGKAQP